MTEQARSTREGQPARAGHFTPSEILQGIGAAAGTTAIVYVVGGMVMWLRFRKAGLPADQAVAVMERQQLLVIGLRLMVLPAVLAGGLAWCVMYLRGGAPRLSSRARTRWKAALATLAVIFALMLPLSFASATWVIAALVIVGYLRYERRPVASPRWPADRAAERSTAERPAPGAAKPRVQHMLASLRRAPAALRGRWASLSPYLPFQRRPRERESAFVATILIVVVAALVSLGRQLDQPIQLLSAAVTIEGRTKPLHGVYISSDSDEVFVGVHEELRAIPRSRVRSMALGPPGERAPSASIVSRVLGGNRFAITPFEWWCNGERYGWGEVGDLCQTQLQIVRPLKVQPAGTPPPRSDDGTALRSDLAGDAVPVGVRCPPEATSPCRGYLRMTSKQRYLFGPAGLPQPVVLSARVKRAEATVDAASAITPGSTKLMCVPIESDARGLLRNQQPGDRIEAVPPGTAKRPLPFDLTISADREGRNVLRRTTYFVSVTRPDQPVEFWGECSTIGVRCQGAAGTRKRADITCTINAKRRFTGTVRLAITDASATTIYARATGQIAGTSRVLTPRATRTLAPGNTYRAEVTITSGPSKAHFVQHAVRLR